MKRFTPCVLAALFALPSLQALAAADLVFTNGKVFTGVPGQPLANAVAVENGKIIKVGSDSEIQALADSGTQRVDLAGKVLMPGMIDTHSHPVIAGLDSLGRICSTKKNRCPNLSNGSSSKTRRGRRGRGCDQYCRVSSAYWEQARELGKIFNHGRWADQPLVLSGIDGHTGWANNAMLKRAKIDAALVKSLPANEQGYVGHEADFTPTGFFAESRWDQVRGQIPPASPEVMLKAAREAVRVNNQYDVTAWMDAASNAGAGDSLFDFTATEQSLGVLPLYRQLAENGELTAHVAALMLTNSKSKPADLEVLARVMKQFEGVPNRTFPGIKVFADGILEYPGQTAAVIVPYKNSNKKGELLIDPAHFGELVVAAEKRGWIVHMHAVGDRAVRESLNGFEYARKLNPAPVAHSISHLQLVNPKEFPRFAQLGVIASMQLLWAIEESYTIDLVKPYISAFAYGYQYPAKSLQDAGAMIAGASDWPVSSPNPWNAIGQAVTRDGPMGVLNAKERVDRQTMFYAYTSNAAKTLGLDEQIGSLVPGKQADLIILDRDVFNVGDHELFDTKVLKTYFGGKQVNAPEA